MNRAPSLTRLPPPSIRVMSYNVRYEHEGEKKHHQWAERKELLVRTIKDKNPDVIGFQEPKEAQLQYLAQSLPEYKWVGKPRDSTASAEYSAIFYKKDRFELEADYTFWLSDQPEWPAHVSWKGLPRVCTWALLRDNQDGKWFAVFNTHLEWEFDVARRNGLSLILWRMNDLYKQHGCQLPMVLIGGERTAPHMRHSGVDEHTHTHTHPRSKSSCFHGSDC
eukprot:TRINITY_DN19286_c0_g1_i1.p1 TRINITY_DN19286_c0_g1~~TRINITY_DN19286_c0_g1_i1.p1  ORF type:complete len:221 (+),score=33.74 TRINITY_DN19286_c0_g1_i1:103-765(+)